MVLLLYNACSTSDDPSRDGNSSGAGSTTAGSAGQATGGSAGTSAGQSTSGGQAGSSAGSGGSGAGQAGTPGGSAGAASGGGAGASGGGAAGAGGAAGGASGGGNFTLSSPELAEGATFAAKHTCAAAGFDKSVAPELNWTAGPAGTKSYAITFIDITLVEGTPPNDLGYHWVLWNIPPDERSLAAGFMDAASIDATQNRAYLGPCPNFGGGNEEHTYEFKVYALGTDELTVTPATGTGAVKDAATKLEASHLAVATLSGKSSASPP